MKALLSTTALMLAFATSGLSQELGQLTVIAKIVDGSRATTVSSVNVYSYTYDTQALEQMGHHMVANNGKLKLNLELNKEYVMDISTSSGVSKRINLNTEVLEGRKYEDQKFAFEILLHDGEGMGELHESFVYYNAGKEEFDFSAQIPVAMQ